MKATEKAFLKAWSESAAHEEVRAILLAAKLVAEAIDRLGTRIEASKEKIRQ